MKGQVLRRAREHLKEPGSSVFNELLTKKLPTFLSRFKIQVVVMRKFYLFQGLPGVVWRNFKLLQEDPETSRIFS